MAIFCAFGMLWVVCEMEKYGMCVRGRGLLVFLSALFCVLLVSGSAEGQAGSGEDAGAARGGAIGGDLDAIEARIEDRGGWGGWVEQLAKPRRRIANLLNSTVGIGERTFFGARREFVFEVDRCSYLLYGNEQSISAIESSKPYRSIVGVNAQLRARGIDLIVVPVPSREEIYADRIVPDFGEPGMISPYRVGFVRALLNAGVEAVDLGPVFVAVRDDDALPLYRYADPHWSSRGMGIAAREIGARLGRYAEIGGGPGPRKNYELTEATIPNRSAIVRQMTDAFREWFRGAPWRVVRVVDEDGGAYEDDDASSVLVMGDSYTAVLRDVDGHFNARLAKEIGMPLALLTQSGGGPTAPAALARKGSDFIRKRRVIVWVFSARYLVEPIAERWENVELPE